MPPDWIQDRFGIYEHLDVTVNMRVLAIRNGAKEITHHDLGRFFQRKRKALGNDSHR